MDNEQYAKLFAKALENAMFKVMTGPVKPQPQPQPQPQRAITFRYGRFETVDLDAAGNIVEPPPRCCYGAVLHAPNCKTWGVCS